MDLFAYALLFLFYFVFFLIIHTSYHIYTVVFILGQGHTWWLWSFEVEHNMLN